MDSNNLKMHSLSDDIRLPHQFDQYSRLQLLHQRNQQATVFPLSECPFFSNSCRLCSSTWMEDKMLNSEPFEGYSVFRYDSDRAALGRAIIYLLSPIFFHPMQVHLLFSLYISSTLALPHPHENFFHSFLSIKCVKSSPVLPIYYSQPLWIITSTCILFSPTYLCATFPNLQMLFVNRSTSSTEVCF